MINSILFPMLFLFQSIQYEVRISNETTKDDLYVMIKNANENDLKIKVLYESYNSNNKVSILQLKAEVEGIGMSTTTFDARSNSCILIYKDLRTDSKVKFGIKPCEVL